MDADDHKVESVLKEDRRFIVPLYQRKYQWAEHRLLPFWEDVQAKAAEVLAGESRFEHYMGALIIAPVDIGSQISKTPVVQVVDGQQRLTTFQLFLVALREVARRHEFADFIDHVNGYLFNNTKSKDTDPLTRFKLTPTPSDRALFHDLMDLDYGAVVSKYRMLFWGTTVPKNTQFPAFRAYFLFTKWIEEFLLNGPSDAAPPEEDENAEVQVGDDQDDAELASDRLEALLNAVLDRLKLVVISLGENDDAQVIFETLNSKGEPLLAMDLVRNNIFHRAEKQGAQVEDLYRKLWDPLDDAWWREPAPNARPTRPRIDHFLAHTLAAETGGKISMRELYAEYRTFAVPKGRPRFDDVEDELRLLEHYAPLYETLEGRRSEDTDLLWFGRKMAAWQTTTVYPVAMQLGADGVTKQTREVVTRLLYSYIVRRALCDLTTKNLNNVFQGLATRFHEEGATLETFRRFFEGRDGASIRFPGDRELRSGIVSKNAYSISPQPRLVDILWELEKASRSNFAEKPERPAGLWVEHVLPQTWTEEWPFPEDGYFAPYSGFPEAIAREAAANSLGNLTLITGGLNISAGNRSFTEKRAKFAEHTGLFLNKWFVGRTDWAEAQIEERSEHLASLAVEIWPALDAV
ncbi:DUF262 domain-containing protein [Sphingobium limneticum]|uniref:DUF262 domain-containing protein n=1 Tax=Sphingobium limneticum TaxID=1007511 RepID=A0A5J5I5Q8_9SPHN|nr:DUF262 domain-containing protein [Sphingobium limneticum]KAA9019635.1 DUF262 domain-containing protein [Sphingobium limneticum]KAA9032092.1 DUF262 domain-containing protein [Sphingobium limneticum]